MSSPIKNSPSNTSWVLDCKTHPEFESVYLEAANKLESKKTALSDIEAKCHKFLIGKLFPSKL